jgi:hypothetical protein
MTSGDAAFAGSVAVKDVTLVNWTSSSDGCGRSVAAFSTNPTSTDAIVPIVVSGLLRDTSTSSTVIAAAVVQMSNPDPGYLNPTDCSDMDCTGILNTAFVDTDGSLRGTGGGGAGPSMVMPFNGPLLNNAPDCAFDSEWNAYVCPS